MWYVPTPDAQLQFLENFQRLLAEGAFTTTYKFALLRALSDLAVLQGDDSGAPLELSTRQIAAQVAELYWRQAGSYRTATIQTSTSQTSTNLAGKSLATTHEAATSIVLKQNNGRQATIISQIAAAREEFGGSLGRFRTAAAPRWRQLVRDVEHVVRVHPLWRMQTLGEQRVEFLYENVGRGSRITLQPGVAYCLRAFYELVRDLVEGAWCRFVQKANFGRLGNVTDLPAFLFGRRRASLEAFRSILYDVQRGHCLYCLRPLSGPSHVDHFIPWRRFPADLGQNFILAHDQCNSAKSDYVPAEGHLETWCDRNRTHAAEFEERLAAADLPGDLAATEQIARWVYGQTERTGGQVWLTGKVLKRLDPRWCLALAQAYDYGYLAADGA
jgi:hypothetical protein